jgi:hypothetical protein
MRRISERLQVWIEARKRHNLSHDQVQMARELGMNPKRLGKLDNHHQERWKLPLPLFIEHLYFKRFGKRRPDSVVSIEEHARQAEHKKALKSEAKQQRRETEQRAGQRVESPAPPAGGPTPARGERDREPLPLPDPRNAQS